MRTIFTIFVLAIAACASSNSGQPSNYSFGYSSDDFDSNTSYLGVDTRDITPDRLGTLGLKEEHGVEVTMVDQDAPAGKAGLKEQDVILKVNDTPIESVEQLRRVIREIPAGRMITLGVSRKGQPLTLKAQLADRSREFAYLPGKNFKFTMPEIHVDPLPNPMPMPMVDMDYPASVVVVHSWMRSGLMVENITPQLGEFFGAKSGQGILVRSVEKGSRAEKAGFHAGDVIIKANGEAIDDASDFSRALRSRKDNNASITILRDKKEQTITLTLPSTRQSGEMLHLKESLEIPDLELQTQAALSEARAEIDDVRPEIEEAMHLQTAEMQKQLAKVKCQVKQLNTEELKKDMREMRRQLREMEIKAKADI